MTTNKTMTSNGRIPRGIEVLVKKASVDSAFCEALLSERAEAAERIGLVLDTAETAMLSAIPESQLIGIIHNTKVSPKVRSAFMGYAAAAMLATIGVTAGGATEAGATEPPAESGDGNDAGFIEDSQVGSDKSIGVGTGIRPDGDFIETGQITVLASCESILGPGSEDYKRSSEVITGKIKSNLSGIKYLYKSILKREPDITGGEVVYEFNIYPNGSTGEVDLVSDEIGNEELSDGIESRILSWSFPAASHEVTVIVSFDIIINE